MQKYILETKSLKKTLMSELELYFNRSFKLKKQALQSLSERILILIYDYEYIYFLLLIKYYL
jgi:hypothetical protein